LDEAKHKVWLIQAHSELEHAAKMCMKDMVRKKNVDLEVMDAEVEEVFSDYDL